MALDKPQIIHEILAHSNFQADLSEVAAAAARLNIQPHYPIVLIGGTNGKGSTCAYLTTILSQAGYKVGTFTSPHVFEYNERIAINGQAISDTQLVEVLQQVQAATTVHLGLFKTFCLASHLFFAQQQIDIAIIEVGIGGSNDVTNLFEPEISAITGVALDHTELLGNDRETIAKQKAGIFRPHKAAYFGETNVPISVVEYATEIQSQLLLAGKDFGFIRHERSWDFYQHNFKLYSLPYPSLRGEEQVTNAALALAIVHQLSARFPVTLSHIKNGLLATSLIGRFQVMPGLPQIILDTAHNPQAVETMHKNMLKLPFAKRNFAVFSIAMDKDWQQVLRIGIKCFDCWYLAPLASQRSCDIPQVVDFLLSCGVNLNQITTLPTITNCVKSAYQQLTTEDRMVCFGSFLVVQEAYQAIQEVRK